MAKKKDLTPDEKQCIYQTLLESCSNGKPKRGKFKELSDTYNICWQSIFNLWHSSYAPQFPLAPVIFKNKKIEAIRPKKWIPDLEAIMAIEPHKRQHIRDLSDEIDPSKSTVGRWMGEGLLKSRSNAMKPPLTNDCKLLRLKFTLTFVHKVQPDNKLMFKSMHNTVHVDEKWFNQRKPCMKIICAPNEMEVYRPGNKCHIPKVMFICAIARPIFGPSNVIIFDGKLGVWSFTKQEPARRSSVNRPAGTMITVTLPSINKDVYRDILISEILPAIKAKWPYQICGKNVVIQQDNAPPHIKDDDPIFRQHASSDGWNIRLIQQPANSPDMNINDLGWFRSLQALQHKQLMNNIDDLIKAVHDSFLELSVTTLSDVWLTLQGCMLEVMKCRGGNNYKLPHMGKQALRRAGNLPENLEVDQDLVRECLLYLMQNDAQADFDELMQSLGVTFMLG